ncbi:MAG TPA: ABC transporter permease [Streptosporangiaceae bacterium]|jgi:peptide/nickel transport system permease protein|nr:ABC transporter permease [Streptosporangiaceae bacterium]
MSLENVTTVLSGDEPGGVQEAEASGGWLWLRAFADNKLAVAGLVVVVALTLFSFLGPLFYHTDQIHTRIGMETLKPGAGHPLGTDDVGYDQLGRLMVGGQTTLEVAFGAAAVAVLVGVAWGAVAGYLGGFIDALMMRIVDALLAIPALLLLLYLATVFQPNVVMLIVVVGLTAWLVPARLVRAEALTLRTREYVLAAKTMGVRTPTLIGRHIVTNSIGTILVNATFQVADAILLVAALSFLGLGIAPPATNWGAMLSNGLNYTYSGYWWLTYPPGIAIVLTVVAFNLIGDGLRDAFGLDTRRR